MPTSAKSFDAQHRERIMVFIDGSNLYHVLGEVCGRHDLNFGKFAEKVAGDRNLVRTYYYNIRQDSDRDPNVATEQGKFLQTMYDTPYLEVRMGVSKRHGETMVEKGVDVFMATDLVAFAFMDMYDTAIVVSGDGDFFPAIQTAKNQGKHVEVAAFDNNLSSEAGNVADAIIRLNKTFFTGLWSDRRRRAASGSSGSGATTTTRRARSTRSSSSSTARSATGTIEPEAQSESTTENTGRSTTRRRTTTTRSTARSSGQRTTQRRRTPTRRTASSSTSDSPIATDTSTAPEPSLASNTESTIISANDGGTSDSPNDTQSRSRTPVRRTPARRRVGARPNSSGDNDRNAPTPPTPPSLRRRARSTNEDDNSSN
ncbi:MAG: NYN domain-containing protein [Dehalococcoidia bacterium]